MLQIITHKNLAGRRSFLRLVGAVAAIVPISGSALALDKHTHSSTAATSPTEAQKNVRTRTTLETAAALRDLWLGHIFWVRNVSITTIDKNDSATKAAESQVIANARSIAASIEPFYGAAAKDNFFKLLAGHYGAVKAYLVATVAGDVTAQATATQSLTTNADEIATFLSKANPYLPKDALQGLPILWRKRHKPSARPAPSFGAWPTAAQPRH